MDALIALHKPRMNRTAAPASAARAADGTGPSACPAQRTTPEQLVPAGSRVVVVAPHPDDEVLALGGTLARLARRGHAITVCAVTDGEGSHPQSAHWTPDALRRTRPRETEDALARLGIRAETIRLGLPDGGVPAHEKTLALRLPLRPDDTVFVPWRFDGHPDHEACARATLAACRTVGARCIEFPVWALVPDHAAHGRLHHRRLLRIAVPPDLLAAKAHATQAFASQVMADGATPPVLMPSALQAWSGREEWAMA